MAQETTIWVLMEVCFTTRQMAVTISVSLQLLLLKIVFLFLPDIFDCFNTTFPF